MSKIAVGGTILRGYGFAARRILGNLGLSWLAAVFYAVAVGYWVQQFCTTMLVSPHPGSELNDFALFDLSGLVVTTALGSAVIARALTGTALEPGGETMTAYFAIAKREWLLFLSLLAFYAFVIAALFAVVLLGRLAITTALPMIGAHAQWQGIGALPAMEAAVALAAFIVTATLAVRLGFFAAAIASAETSMNMARAWSISRGNSWRIFAVAIGLSVPALLLWTAAGWALIGSDLTGALTTALSSRHDSTPLYQLIGGNASVIAGMWTLLIVVLNMLFAGASAPAYLTVRDNVSVRRQRSVSVSTSPVLEPAFAGSFAGFAPRHAKAPEAAEVAPHTEPASDVFTATPEATMTAAEMPAETFMTTPQAVDGSVSESPAVEMAEEPEIVAPQAEDAGQPPAVTEDYQGDAALAHVEAALTSQQDDANEPMPLTDGEPAHDDVHDPMPLTYTHEASFTAIPMSTAQFPLGAAETNELPDEQVKTAYTDAFAEVVELHAEAVGSHVAADETIPRPSHDGELELSQQNAPSEAA
jgi:hypothetical protein